MTEEELRCSGIAASVAVYLDHSVQLNGLRYWSTWLSDFRYQKTVWVGAYYHTGNWFWPVCQ